MDWFELTAVAIALAMVFCNIKEIHWGWPLAIVSSAMYVVVFGRARLYGDAALNVFYAIVGFWGWYQWLRGHRADGTVLHVAKLSRRGIGCLVLACAAAWPATGLFLKTFTDTDVPWWDGFTTGLSVVAQFLLGRKFVENWLLWAVVNVVSIALYAYKGLYPTVGLYVVLLAMSFVGFRAWRAKLPA
jgi:nicotinamide mononucleotide transporter